MRFVVVLPYVSQCETFYNDLHNDVQRHTSTCFGRNGISGLQHVANSVLLVTTPDGVVNNWSNMALSGVSVPIIVTIDEVDVFALDSGFRSVLFKAITILSPLAFKLVMTTATGTFDTLQVIQTLPTFQNKEPIVNCVGELGIRARPDVRFQFHDLNMVKQKEVWKKREAKIIELVEGTREPIAIVLPHLYDKGERANDNYMLTKKVQALVDKLRALPDADFHLLTAQVSREDRETALAAITNADRNKRIIYVCSEIMSRVNVRGLKQLILAAPMPTVEEFIQISGRVGRGPGCEGGTVHVIHRYNDANTYLMGRLHGGQDVSIGEAKRKGMVAMAHAIKTVDTCFLQTMHRLETSDEIDPCGKCVQCQHQTAHRVPYPEMTETFRTILRAIDEIHAANQATNYATADKLAQYLVGADAVAGAVTQHIGDENAVTFGALRTSWSRASVEKIVSAMMLVPYIKFANNSDDLPTVMVMDKGREFANDGAAMAHVIPSSHVVLKNLSRRAMPSVRAPVDASAPVGKNERWEKTLKRALGNNKPMELVPAFTYGANVLLYHLQIHVPYLIELDKQPLIDKSGRELIQFGLESARTTEEQRKQLVKLVHGSYINVMGADDAANWTVTTFCCTGARQCPADGEDGERCQFTHTRQQKQGCPEHGVALENVDCYARVLILANQQQKREIVMLLSSHTHHDVPVRKVPPALQNRFIRYVESNPDALTSEITRMVVPGLNNDNPIELGALFPRLASADVRHEFARAATKRLVDGTSASAQIARLQDESDNPQYIRGVLRTDLGEIAIGLALESQIDAGVDGASEFQCDQTFDVTQKTPNDDGNDTERTWYLYNVTTIYQGHAFVCFRVLMNARTESAYQLAFELFHKAFTDKLRELGRSDKDLWTRVVSTILVDFERAEINGLTSFLCNTLGHDAGGARMREILKTCRQHWKRIVRDRHAPKYGNLDLFSAIGVHLSTLNDVETAKSALRLLKHNGDITQDEVAALGLTDAAQLLAKGARTVDWSGHARWVDGLLADPNCHVFESLINDPRHANIANSSTTNAGESSNLGVHDLKGKRTTRKTIYNTVKKLKEKDVAAETRNRSAADGNPMQNRSPESAGQRINDQASRRFRNNAQIRADAELAMQQPDNIVLKARGTVRDSCTCKGLNCVGQCSCIKQARGCSTKCACKGKCANENNDDDDDNAMDGPGAASDVMEHSNSAAATESHGCKCTKGCKGKCGCKTAGRACTEACKCKGECTRAQSKRTRNSDDDFNAGLNDDNPAMVDMPESPVRASQLPKKTKILEGEHHKVKLVWCGSNQDDASEQLPTPIAIEDPLPSTSDYMEIMSVFNPQPLMEFDFADDGEPQCHHQNCPDRSRNDAKGVWSMVWCRECTDWFHVRYQCSGRNVTAAEANHDTWICQPCKDEMRTPAGGQPKKRERRSTIQFDL